MSWGDSLLAVGSGFIASLNGSNYLVTARHNLAGRHWETNELLSTRGVAPDRVTVRMQANTPGALTWANRTLALVDEADFPIWFEHPRFGRDVDVAVLALQDDDAYFVDSFDISRPAPAKEPVLSAGDDLFVVGFPRGFTAYVGIPIWVRASVASEPAFGYKGLPNYLVDARTTMGQSGSAVVLRPGVNRAVRMVDDSIVGTSIDDAWIAGVYSGRVGLVNRAQVEVEGQAGPSSFAPIADQFDIGIVWTTGAILATIESRTRFPSAAEGGARWAPADDWSGAFDDEAAADEP